MVVKIRLACLGKRNNPLFKLTVANSTAKRDGKRLDTLGMYDPKPDSLGAKHITINFDRAKYWLALGAQPSPTVARLFGKVFNETIKQFYIFILLF